MGDAPKTPADVPPFPPDVDPPTADDREASRGISDFVRRAVSVGVGAAQRSKDDIMRAAGIEVRSWLDRLNVHDELVKLLSKMSVEVKAEIRFKPRDDKDAKTAVPDPVTDPPSRPEKT